MLTPLLCEPLSETVFKYLLLSEKVIFAHWCYFHNMCDVIFVWGFWDQKTFKTFSILVCYIDKSNKSDIQDKFPVCTYLPSIISRSINFTASYKWIFSHLGIFWYPYNHITNSLNFYKHVTHLFNILAIVSIDTELYTWKIQAYNIVYLSIACLLVRDRCVLVVR